MARKKAIKDVEAEEEVKKVEAIQDEDTEVEEDTEVVEDEEIEIDDDYEEVDKKKVKKSKEDKNHKEKKQTKKDGYFKQVNKELKKVVWPKGSEIFKYSLAVLVFCAVLCLFFVGISLLFSKIVEVFF